MCMTYTVFAFLSSSITCLVGSKINNKLPKCRQQNTSKAVWLLENTYVAMAMQIEKLKLLNHAWNTAQIDIQ